MNESNFNGLNTDPNAVFSLFNKLYNQENSREELAKRTVGLWVKIHQANKKTTNLGDKNKI